MTITINMTPEEKIEYVRRELLDKAKLNPAGGSFYFKIEPLLNFEVWEETMGRPFNPEYEEYSPPQKISRTDKWSIIQKFTEKSLGEGYFIESAELDDKKQGAWIKLVHTSVIQALEEGGFIPRTAKDQPGGKLKFDSQNCVIRYGDIKYSFHRGTKGNKPRLRFFKKLWEERRYIRNGKVAKQGEMFPIKALSEQVEVSPIQITSMVKGLNRMLREKSFSAKIERKNGILLVVTEK